MFLAKFEAIFITTNIATFIINCQKIGGEIAVYLKIFHGTVYTYILLCTIYLIIAETNDRRKYVKSGHSSYEGVSIKKTHIFNGF